MGCCLMGPYGGTAGWPRAVAQDPESGVQLAPPPIVNPAVWAPLACPRTVGAMATSVSHRDGPVRQNHRVPWSPQAWGQVLYLAGGIPAQVLAPLVVVALGLAIDPRQVKVNLLPGL